MGTAVIGNLVRIAYNIGFVWQNLLVTICLDVILGVYFLAGLAIQRVHSCFLWVLCSYGGIPCTF